MKEIIGVIVLILVCVLLLLKKTVRKKFEWLLDIVMRSLLGMIAIYFINSMCTIIGASLGVGLNVWTAMTVGILGIPGLIALYGMGIYRLF